MLSTGSDGRRSCENCGSVHEITYIDYPDRDKGVVRCEACGYELFRWKGTRDYSARLVERKEQPQS
jgi:hypothetical protein